MLIAVRRTVIAASLVAVVAGCGGGSAASPAGPVAPTGATPAPAASQAAPAATTAPASGGTSASDIAGACTDLTSLKTMDYAFGEKLSNMRIIDASGRARTLDDVTYFSSTAPADLRPALNDLVLVWTDLVRDPSSVADNDARFASADAALQAWMAANCKS